MYYSALLANFMTFTVLVEACTCASSLDGPHWTGTTSVSWFIADAHFTQSLSGILPRGLGFRVGRGFVKRIA
jgi:hypothetical protein